MMPISDDAKRAYVERAKAEKSRQEIIDKYVKNKILYATECVAEL